MISHIRRIDEQLDRLQSVVSSSASEAPQPAEEPVDETVNLERILELQAAIKLLSTAAASRGLASSDSIQTALWHVIPTASTGAASDDGGLARTSPAEQHLQWFLVSKITVHTYGITVNALLEQNLPLGREIWYWDEVIGSAYRIGIYSLQTWPVRFLKWNQKFTQEVRLKLQSATKPGDFHQGRFQSVSSSWAYFYSLVRDSIRKQSGGNLHNKVSLPLTKARLEVRSKIEHLKRLREMSACGLGILMDEGLTLEVVDEGLDCPQMDNDEWKTILLKSVSLMETILCNVTSLDFGTNEFEDTVFTNVDNDSEFSQTDSRDDHSTKQLAFLADRLQQILHSHLPSYVDRSRKLAAQYGRPSRLVRYWFLATVLFLSLGTLSRVAVRRKAQIWAWIQNLGATTVDFWYNWVIEPAKRVIGTIRHDKNSEIAIMSKGSLEGDRASLERMVIEFVKDNPGSTPFDMKQNVEIQARVKEGDLTPVLKAYEKDMRRPIFGTVRGDLIRTLLIQLQKSKVDVEVAMGGIDTLLKSQELVFG